jgi:hypothetical protein
MENVLSARDFPVSLPRCDDSVRGVVEGQGERENLKWLRKIRAC